LGEMREQRRGVEEKVKVEVEGIAGGERETVQVTCSEDKGSRWIGETAGGIGGRRWFENACVPASVALRAGSGAGTIWGAYEAAKSNSERAAQQVRGLARREVDAIVRGEVEAKWMEPEGQRPRITGARWA
jgi:hypothetical protein